VLRPRLAWLALLCVTSCSERKQTTQLQERATQLQATLEQMLPHRFGNPVTAGMQAEAKVRRYQQRLRSVPGFEKLTAGLGDLLVTVGLVPAEAHIDDLLIGMETSENGGYYDYEGKALFAVKPLQQGAELDRFCLHGLVHALQDQRFDLRRYLAPEVGLLNLDSFIARRFVTEGEARYVEGLYELARLGGRTGGEVPVMGEDYFREVAAMPYQNGGAPTHPVRADDAARRVLGRIIRLAEYAGPLAVHGMRAWRGWYGVDTLFHSPPRSTEQMLHPEKLSGQLGADEPIPVSLIDLGSLLGPGWKPVFENTAGEALVQVLLTEQLAEADYRAALSAAAGWAGDRFRIYRRNGHDRPILSWRTQWDSDRDAHQFEMAYTRAASTRNARRSWPAAIVRRSGTTAVIIEGADEPLASALAGALLVEGSVAMPEEIH
jgi:hypothetical protein